MEAAKPTEPCLSSSKTHHSNMMGMSITDPSKSASPLRYLLGTSSTRTQSPHPHVHNQLLKPVIRTDFMCNYCHRKFHSAQALGGHQNAHRRERAATLAQSRHQSSSGEAAMAFTYSNVQHHHGYSMMHKPALSRPSLLLSSSSFSNPSCHLYGHLGQLYDGGRLAVEVPSPCVTKLINIGGRTVGSSALDGGMGAGLLGRGGRLQTNDEEELEELDLSLKL